MFKLLFHSSIKKCPVAVNEFLFKRNEIIYNHDYPFLRSTNSILKIIFKLPLELFKVQK